MPPQAEAAERQAVDGPPTRPAALAVSVVILASRPGRLKTCLRTLSEADAPLPAEILVVCNGALALSRDETAAWKLRLPGLSVLDILKSPLGAARNFGAEAARHPSLLFLDDDILVPRHFFRVLGEKLDRFPDAAALGGPNRTPGMSSMFQRCVGHVLASAFGAGPMRRRYRGLAGDGRCDDTALMLCNLVLRRARLPDPQRPFPEDMERNEENLLLDALRARGEILVHCPDLFVDHERRGNFSDFARQCYLSGVGRGQMTRKRPDSLRWFFLAPLAPAASLLLAAAWPFGGGGLSACYAAAAAVCAFELSANFPAARMRAFFTLWRLFPSGHLSYAAGFLMGLRRA